MCGSVLIIFSYGITNEKSTVRKLLVCLSLCDFAVGLGNLIGMILLHYGHNGISCKIQSFITTTSSVSSFCWNTAIAYYVLFSLLFDGEASDAFIFPFHLICWGLPLLSVSLAAGFNALGADQYFGKLGWCWIGPAEQITWPKLPANYSQLFWQIVAGKAIEVISYILTPALYIASRNLLQAEHNQKTLLLQEYTKDALQEADRKLVLVPVIFILMRFWGTLRLFLNWSLPTAHVSKWFWLALLQGIGDSGQGCANCILFCILNQKIRNSISTYFKDLCSSPETYTPYGT